ncbi:hypothetical protein D3C77_339610 [compost metagenome]
MQVIHRLQNLIREFRERNPGIQAACYNIFGQHRVDAEILPIIPQKIYYVQLMRPIVVVHQPQLIVPVSHEQLLHLRG